MENPTKLMWSGVGIGGTISCATMRALGIEIIHKSQTFLQGSD
jgi:hypothetical protein